MPTTRNYDPFMSLRIAESEARFQAVELLKEHPEYGSDVLRLKLEERTWQYILHYLEERIEDDLRPPGG